jgi:putative pyruvate formate lyase activating enzyme
MFDSPINRSKESSLHGKIALLEKRTPNALALLDDCTICPRDCHVNRNAGSIKGICGVDSRLKISSANLHFGEEPPISGNRGSGTIFLSGCNLKCAYCQNFPISQLRHGDIVTIEEAAGMMLDLERRGAHNINFVTPSHYVPQLMAAMLASYKLGLTLPIVWNCSGYDKVETLRLLDGIVEIYMPDMRYAVEENARCYSAASDYPEINRAAIKEMYRQVGDLVIDDDGIAVRGLLVRHLVLPENISGSKEIFEFLAREISPETHVSLMSQYFPAHKALSIDKINRRILKSEYQEALDAFEAAGLQNGWAQPYGES